MALLLIKFEDGKPKFVFSLMIQQHNSSSSTTLHLSSSTIEGGDEYMRKTLEKEGYIGKFEHFEDKRGGKFKIQLLAKITKCGAITPRFKVKKTEYSVWEQQYLQN